MNETENQCIATLDSGSHIRRRRSLATAERNRESTQSRGVAVVQCSAFVRRSVDSAFSSLLPESHRASDP
jgi:hypothetical protein